MLTEFLYTFSAVLIAIWYFNKRSRPKNYPPGPFIFPVIGSLPVFAFGGKTFFEKLDELRNLYGDIFSFNIGSSRIVILHDYNIIKEAYNRDEFNGRPSVPPVILIAGKEKRGLVASEGKQWMEQRRFALKQLRDFGFGKKSMEAQAQEDVLDLINQFKSETGHPIPVARRFNLAVFNSLWQIIAGEKFQMDDPKYQTVMNKLNAAISNVSSGGVAFAVPWLLKLFPGLTGWSKFKQAVPEAKKLIQGYIDEHKKTFQEDNFRDFMDVYINEIKQTSDPDSSFYKNAGEENNLVSVLNLFAAGSETTSSTLNWSFFYLSKNMDVQKKFQDEIDLIIGKSRLPVLSDRDNMPYCTALMQEILRKSSLVPFGIVHNTLQNVDFHGYRIPKDTIIFANLYDVHHNSRLWGDPENFRPERFLSKNEKELLKTTPPVLPFSIGKRQCLGETLARNNFFLILTSCFQRFTILPDPNGEVNPKEPAGIFRFPPPFKVIFQDRQV